MVKIEFTPLSLDRKIFPFKKGFKKNGVSTTFLSKVDFWPYLTIFGHVLKRGVLDEFELVTFFR